MGELRTLEDGSGNTIGFVVDTAVDSTGDARLATANSDTGRFVSVRETTNGLEPYDEANDTALGDWNFAVPLEIGSLDTPFTASTLLSTPISASSILSTPIPRGDLDIDATPNSVGSAYTTSGEDTIHVTSSGTTVTLADADAEDGAEVTIKDQSGNAGSTALQVDTGGTQDVQVGNSAPVASGSLPTNGVTSNYGSLTLEFESATSTWWEV